MANTDTTAINDLLPTVIAEAVDHFETVGNSKALFQNYRMTQGVMDIPTWDDTISIYSMLEGVPMGTSQQMTTGKATLTAAKYGAKTRITDEAIRRARNAGNYDLIQFHGKELGVKAAKKVNNLVTSLFSGFATGSGSGSGTTLTPALLLAAYTTVYRRGALSEPFAILDPWHLHHLKLDALYRATYQIQPGTMDLGAWLPAMERINGVPVYADNDLTIASSASYGCVATKEALALGIEWDAAESAEVTRVEQTGWDVSISFSCAVIEVKDLGGYYLYYKAAA
jgi:hypothetical protein